MACIKKTKAMTKTVTFPARNFQRVRAGASRAKVSEGRISLSSRRPNACASKPLRNFPVSGKAYYLYVVIGG